MKRSVLLKTTAMVFALQGGLAAMSAAPALAQDGEASSGRDTIVVTARKKEESLLDAPLAVTAFTGGELEAAGIDRIEDIAKAAPGLDFEAFITSPGRQSNSPFIRGITRDVVLAEPLSQTVGVFVDGIYLTGGTRALGVEDVERVEVIKGPQSAVYGRATFAGAINYVTSDPSEEFGARLSVLAATRGEYEAIASVEGPLAGDAIRGRLTGRYKSKDGHWDNNAVPDQRLGDEETLSLAATILFEPSDNWRTRIRGAYSNIDDGPAATYFLDSTFATFGDNPASNARRVIAGPLHGVIESDVGLNTSDATFALFRDAIIAKDAILINDGHLDHGFGLSVETFRGSIDTSYNIGGAVTVDALVGINRENSSNIYDNDNTDFARSALYYGLRNEDLTAELRLSGALFNDNLSWSIGGSYFDAEFENQFMSANFTRDVNGVPVGATGSAFIGTGTTLRTAENIGVFAQLNYSITDRLTLGLEGRYSIDDIAQFNVSGTQSGGVTSTDHVNGSPATFKAFLPRITLDWKPVDDTLLYFTYSEGNFPGGFNGGAFANLSPSQLAEVAMNFPSVGDTFDEESLENYEFGWKQSVLDGRGSFALSVFHMKRSDEVVNRLVEYTEPTAVGGIGTATGRVNAQSSEINGVEFEGFLDVTDTLEVSGSFAIIDSEVVDFPDAGAQGAFDIFGRVLGADATPVGKKAPRFASKSAAVSATYTHPRSIDIFGSSGNFYARGDAFYVGPRFLTLINAGETNTSVDLALRAGIRSDKGTSLEVFVTNVLGEDAATSANQTADRSELAVGFNLQGANIGLRDKRQFGIRASVEF